MAKPKKSKVSSRISEIKRRTRRKFSAEEKIRIVLEGVRGEENIAEICRKEKIHPNMYYRWSKEFLEAGKKLPAQKLIHLKKRMLSSRKLWPK